MGKTISVSSGTVAMKHDRRDYESGKFPENINEELSVNNIYFKTCKNEREAFNNFFQESVNEYNERQTRADRKKSDYYGELLKSKNGETPIYEYVFQIGNKEDTRYDSADGIICKEILANYARDFEKDNPNFHVLSSCLHVDEPDGTPHLHIAFIPYAKGYKKGLETRCSTSKALESMGFTGDERNMKFWKRSQEEKIEFLMKECDIERVKLGSTRDRLPVQLYKEMKDLAWEQINEDFAEEMARMDEQLEEKASAVMSLQNKEFELVARRDELLDNIKSLENRSESLLEEISTRRVEKYTLENEIKRFGGILERLSKECDTMIQKLEEFAKMLKETPRDFSGRVADYLRSKRINGMTAYDDFKATQMTLQERFNTAIKESKESRQSMSDWRSQIERSSSSGSVERSLNKNLTKQIDESTFELE